MWAPILYKAMAKAYGSYYNFLYQTDTVNPLMMLTGAPVFNLDLSGGWSTVCSDSNFIALFLAYPVFGAFAGTNVCNLLA